MIRGEQSGFTIVELIVTLVVGVILISTFYLLYSTGVQVDAQLSRKTLAQNIAYNGLRKYSEAQLSSWPTAFVCDNTSNSLLYPSAPGQILEDTPLTSAALPGTPTLTVRAYAPYGCGASEASMPKKIQATVKYGNDGTEEVYATYSKN